MPFAPAEIERTCPPALGPGTRRSFVGSPALIFEANLIGQGCHMPLKERAWQVKGDEPRNVGSAHELFEAQVAATPNATALVFEGRAMSFSELDQRANLLANYLRSEGVGPDTLVGHYLERGLDMVVGLLAILKAGGAYVPLDPAYPRPCLRHMLDDSGVRLVLTQRSLVDDLAGHQTRPVVLDGEWEMIAACPRVPPGNPPTANQLAYVIYTSGSTGRPKGVQISHGALLNFLRSMRRSPGLSSRDVLLAITSLSFDIAALELLLPLAVGAPCVLVGRDVASDGAKLAAKLVESGASVMQATPTTWLMLLESGWDGDDGLTILCGGEAMPRELADRLRPRCRELWNLYGPTETTIWSTLERVELSNKPVSIGAPIDNTEVYVLSPDGQPVDVGCEGEIYIGGDGVARGYWNRPKLTAERFVPDPFSGRPGARLYKTGDLARWHADGRLEYLGRIDHQVKIRGFRIELEAIDASLSRHPLVARVVTVAREDTPGEKRLVSYVVRARIPSGQIASTGIKEADLRQYLVERLPAPMIPATFVMLDAMPLTPNGKIDRAALPPPDPRALRCEIEFVPPADELETALASDWERVFARSPIGVEDDFFMLGGHSLLALRLVMAMEQTSGHRLPIGALIQAPTIRQLARVIRNATLETDRSSLVEVQPGGDAPPFFCLPGGTGIVDGLGILSIRHLAGLIGHDRPVFSFQISAWDRDAPGVERLEHLAEIFVQDLRARFPNGPYLLGGYSSGALVAHEMARILREQGETVGLVALIDMWGVNFPIKLSRIQRWWQKSATELRSRFFTVARHPLRELRQAVGVPIPAPDGDSGFQWFERMVDNYRVTLASRHYPGKLTLFRASEPMDKPGFSFDEPSNGCSTLAEDLEVHLVPGDHLSLMREPAVPTLAACLRNCLRQAQANLSPRPPSRAGSVRQSTLVPVAAE